VDITYDLTGAEGVRGCVTSLGGNNDMDLGGRTGNRQSINARSTAISQEKEKLEGKLSTTGIPTKTSWDPV